MIRLGKLVAQNSHYFIITIRNSDKPKKMFKHKDLYLFVSKDLDVAFHHINKLVSVLTDIAWQGMALEILKTSKL